jgi:hypothetical protein
MDLWPQSNVASSFTILKGAMIEESYRALALWRIADSKKQNIERLQQEKFMGPRSAAWYRNAGFVLSRRFDPGFMDRALVELAKRQWALHEWKPALLWHMTRNEFLLRDFLVNWLFPAWAAGVGEIRTPDLYPHLETVPDRGGIIERRWTLTTLERVAGALLRMGVDFGLLQGRAVKEFTPYKLPGRSLLYLLHAVRDSVAHSDEVVRSADWRIFRITEAELANELSRLYAADELMYEDGLLFMQYTSALEYAIES